MIYFNKHTNDAKVFGQWSNSGGYWGHCPPNACGDPWGAPF